MSFHRNLCYLGWPSIDLESKAGKSYDIKMKIGGRYARSDKGVEGTLKIMSLLLSGHKVIHAHDVAGVVGRKGRTCPDGTQRARRDSCSFTTAGACKLLEFAIMTCINGRGKREPILRRQTIASVGMITITIEGPQKQIPKLWGEQSK